MDKLILFVKHTASAVKKAKSFKTLASILLIFTFIFTYFCSSYSKRVNNNLSNDIIRLHVIANSDSDEDQELKRSVRDVILKYMRNSLSTSKNIETTKKMIIKDMDKIRELARCEIKQWNKDYRVKTTLSSYPFPTKSYGDVALPAGNYQALRVVIGNGEGANWWCVLFPPLCFVDATHGTIPDDVKKNLKASLSEEEYSIITSTSSDDIPVKVRFKVLEVFEGTKIKASTLINKISRFKKRSVK